MAPPPPADKTCKGSIMKRIGWFVGLAGLLLAAGCANQRPVYKEPALTAAQTATLKGSWGAYIEDVDGKRVESATFRMANFGFNTVHVTGAEHHLIVIQNLNSGGSSTTHQGTSQFISQFKFRFVAGHTYEFGPASFWQSMVLKVTDKTTGQSCIIESEPVEDDAPGYLYDLMGA
jgi:hypothetical protein